VYRRLSKSFAVEDAVFKKIYVIILADYPHVKKEIDQWNAMLI